jgi:radical SAM protein with 4Fe4S-binding SPASM domain
LLNNADVRQFRSDKILKHLDVVSDWIKGGNPSPITVEIDMTNVCNHSCPECVVDYYQKNDSNALSFDESKRIIDQLAEAKVRGLTFTGGGEPLCNVHTVDAVVYAEKSGLDVAFITNCSLMSEEKADALVSSCVWIRVSLDAATSETFKITHGKNSTEFDKVINGTKMLVEAKKRLKAKCIIGAGYLTSDETVREMETAAVLCKNIGVDYLQYRPMQIHHGGEFSYHWTEVNSLIEKCLQHSNNSFKILFSKHKYEMMQNKDYGRNYGKCYGHQFATVISASGDMYVCCHLRGYQKYKLGNIKEQSFMEIWNSEQRRKAYENINFKDCIPLCRCNTFNQILWELKKPADHVNFL